MTLLNKVTTITIQISQFSHFQLRLRGNTMASSSIGLIVITEIKVAIFIVNYYNKGRLIICAIFVVERAKSFSKIAGAGVAKTRHGLIASIVVDLKRTPTICMQET